MTERTVVYENLSEAGTEALAGRLAKLLMPDMFLAFYGDMGAGKTMFIRALAAGFGISDAASPTFTIVREHVTSSGTPFLHFDAYRLRSADELYAIGFEDYLARGGILAMEWSENVADALPAERLEISISGSGSEPRGIRLAAKGQKYTDLLSELIKS